jgi:hypothetical protein
MAGRADTPGLAQQPGCTARTSGRRGILRAMNTEQRLAAVEDQQRDMTRSLRRWRWASAGLAAGLLVMIEVAAAPGAQDLTVAHLHADSITVGGSPSGCVEITASKERGGRIFMLSGDGGEMTITAYPKNPTGPQGAFIGMRSDDGKKLLGSVTISADDNGGQFIADKLGDEVFRAPAKK